MTFDIEDGETLTDAETRLKSLRLDITMFPAREAELYSVSEVIVVERLKKVLRSTYETAISHFDVDDGTLMSLPTTSSLGASRSRLPPVALLLATTANHTPAPLPPTRVPARCAGTTPTTHPTVLGTPTAASMSSDGAPATTCSDASTQLSSRKIPRPWKRTRRTTGQLTERRVMRRKPIAALPPSLLSHLDSPVSSRRPSSCQSS